MEFSCCSRREKSDDINSTKEKVRTRSDSLNLIQNFKKSVKIECSYILCIKMGIRPLEIQATIGNNIYYFCSTECWEDWLKEYDIKNCAFSPSSLKSPDIIKGNSHLEDIIPPLFI